MEHYCLKVFTVTLKSGARRATISEEHGQRTHTAKRHLNNLLEGFSRGACPFHGTCLDFTSLYWLMWFDSLPLLGPGGLAILLFFVFFCVCFFFSRERYQSTRFPGAPPIHTTMRLPIQTGVSAPTAAVGDGSGSLCGPGP